MSNTTDANKKLYEDRDIVPILRSPATVFYEYAADNGELLRRAADEIEKLRKQAAP